MMNILNRNSCGFVKFFDETKGNFYTLKGASCSQSVKMTHTDSNKKIIKGYIEFGYPTDWLISYARNPKFLKYWLETIKKFFHEVEYIGQSNAKNFDINFKDYSVGSVDKVEDNLGDIIVNDSWETFRIHINNHSAEKQLRQYAAYCMVRYLFSDHYCTIIRTFQLLKRFFENYGIKCSEFELLQMSHYYFSGINPYYVTYSLLGTGSSKLGKVKKLIKLEEFDKLIANKADLHPIFNSRGDSPLSILDFQEKIDIQKFKEVYETIK